MTWQVQWTPPARRNLGTLPPRAATAIITYVEERLSVNPKRLSKSLHAEFSGLRSARNGDYRVLFRLRGDTIVIVRVDHRAHAYRPM